MIQWGFILLLVVLVTLFDVWIIKKKGKSESLSAVMIRTFRTYPAITAIFFLLVGFVFGHLTWSMRTEDIYKNVDCIERVKK